MDAIKIGARVYHASCHDEVKKAGGNTPMRTSTPESVLGKRKATGVSTREHSWVNESRAVLLTFSQMNDMNSLRNKMPKEIKA